MISVGDLVVISQYARRMYRPLSDLAKQSTRVSRNMARAERVAEVLGADEVLEDRAGAFAEAARRARSSCATSSSSTSRPPGARRRLADVPRRRQPRSPLGLRRPCLVRARGDLRDRRLLPGNRASARRRPGWHLPRVGCRRVGMRGVRGRDGLVHLLQPADRRWFRLLDRDARPRADPPAPGDGVGARDRRLERPLRLCVAADRRARPAPHWRLPVGFVLPRRVHRHRRLCRGAGAAELRRRTGPAGGLAERDARGNARTRAGHIPDPGVRHVGRARRRWPARSTPTAS